MLLRKARPADVDALCELYETVSNDLEANGLRQWRWGTYPSRKLVEEDVQAEKVYCLYGELGMSMAVTVDTEADEAYGSVNWLLGVRPGYFHRLAVRPELRGRGLGRQAVADVESILRSMGCDCIRADAGHDNGHAAGFYRSMRMRAAGQIRFKEREEYFIAFEKRLEEDCPLLPQRMRPAFRSGRLTPWGGERLRTAFGKAIPEVPTGECLEVSCIPGLESVNAAGEALPEMIRRYGSPLVGRYDLQPFPLLLKLIDASDSLSVQVHPGDAYAAAHEGKSGKTEAWLILDAPEGAELVYGLREGTTLEELRAACEQGAAVEPLLRRVPVRPGDVCYIPAGCVHAIGAGILLYEIQQSSDVTYRFYDWDRTDAKGNRRELHLRQALDVVDLTLRPEPVPAQDQPVARVVDGDFFSLDLLSANGRVLVPGVRDFGILTALNDGLSLQWEGGELSLTKGETVLLPHTCPRLVLRGKGRAALAMPR